MNEQDNEIIKTVQETCLNAEGVSRFPANGVRMNRDNGKLVFDLYLRVRYGERIPSLAWNLQQAVVDSIKQKTDEKIKEVNIHIQGVDI